MSFRVVVADDEHVARTRLTRLLKEAGCEVVAEFENGTELLNWLKAQPSFEALFLDIRMPGLSGIEVKAELDESIPVVFVTANPQHAVAAFELAAVDFLVKPVTPERLQRTLARLHAQPGRTASPAAPAATPSASTRIAVKAGGGKLLLELRKITHFEVEDQVVWALVGPKRFRTTWTSLSELEEAMPDLGFMRIQRHILIRPESVLGLRTLPTGKHNVLLPEGIELEVSRSAHHQLKEKLGL